MSVTIVATLGGISAGMIILNQDKTIGVDTEDIEYDIQINETTYQIEDFNFRLPFSIYNIGFFDLENLELSISLEMNYTHVNYTAPGVNTTRQIVILSNEQNFGTVPKGTKRYFNFTADMSNFYNVSLPDFETEVDWTRGPPAIEFYATLIINLDYTLGMHSLTAGITNILIGEI
ncbi:MAG: hypothetical protein ACFFDH_01820 [Promethearchaeota archaeon]